MSIAICNIKDLFSGIFAVLLLTGFVVLFCAAPLSAQVEWQRVKTKTGGDDRVDHAMAYDSRRNVTVLFGGRQENFLYGDTMEWNGSRWTVVGQAGPSARYGHAMAYDAKRKVVVMFGGVDSKGKFLEDLWTWDGQTWREINQSGQRPYPRMGHAMAYDSRRKLVVMVGGLHDDGAVSPSTWEWNGSKWSHRGNFYYPDGPEPRYGHAMTYDSDNDVVLMHGGTHEDGSMSPSTWEWDGGEWTIRSSVGPIRRSWHAMAYDSSRQLTVLFGGWRDGTVFDDTWEWNGTTWSRHFAGTPDIPLPADEPLARWGHGMVFDRNKDVIVLFGGAPQSDHEGYLNRAYSDTWFLGPPGSAQIFDLMIKVVKGAPRSLETNEQLKLTARVKNKSGFKSDSCTIKFYLSPDKELDASDLLLGSTEVPALNKRKGKKIKKVVIVPATLGAGSYYVISELVVSDANPDNDIKAGKKVIKVS